mmetsp:Transcript_14443/g.37009  ORF Transcript_14443/g.37009 Transcript_14443/m.37009 type:complete len:209 (-) Transcript_14443:249-875(-)
MLPATGGQDDVRHELPGGVGEQPVERVHHPHCLYRDLRPHSHHPHQEGGAGRGGEGERVQCRQCPVLIHAVPGKVPRAGRLRVRLVGWLIRGGLPGARHRLRAADLLRHSPAVDGRLRADRPHRRVPAVGIPDDQCHLPSHALRRRGHRLVAVGLRDDQRCCCGYQCWDRRLRHAPDEGLGGWTSVRRLHLPRARHALAAQRAECCDP